WPLINPKTEGGRSLAMAIAVHTARCSVVTGKNDQEIGGAAWMAFLTRLVGAHVKSEPPASIFPRAEGFIPLQVLEKAWRSCPWKGNAWNVFWRKCESISNNN